jgi:hypothetical protein
VVDDRYWSVASRAWSFALTPQLEHLLEAGRRWAQRDSQVSDYENGHAAAAIVLGVCLVESVAVRVAYRSATDDDRRPARERTRSALSFVRFACPTEDLGDRITEVFVCRDALVHNHLWEVAIRSDLSSDQPSTIVDAVLLSGGDEKYRQAVDSSGRSTRILGLNVIPSSVRRSDAAVALKTIIEVLDVLPRMDVQNMPSAADHQLRVNGKLGPLRQWVRALM